MVISTARVGRVGVVGDVHCEAETLSRVLDALETMNVDAVLCVGDLVDGPGDADQTLAILQARGVKCVAGNHERWFLDGERRDVADATENLNEASTAFLRELRRSGRFQAHSGPEVTHPAGNMSPRWGSSGDHSGGSSWLQTYRPSGTQAIIFS